MNEECKLKSTNNFDVLFDWSQLQTSIQAQSNFILYIRHSLDSGILLQVHVTNRWDPYKGKKHKRTQYYINTLLPHSFLPIYAKLINKSNDVKCHLYNIPSIVFVLGALFKQMLRTWTLSDVVLNQFAKFCGKAKWFEAI